MSKLDDIFLSHACDVLAETNTGLTGKKIVEYSNLYATEFNRTIIPYKTYPFEAKSKRNALKENISVFEAKEQFKIIKEMLELPQFQDNPNAEKLKRLLFKNYGYLATEKISDTELIQNTKHWLSNHEQSLKQYNSALAKYEGNIFERNTLDDMRLAFELLVKDLLGNNKSLENQINDLGSQLKEKGASEELRNMVVKIIDYYTKFQNNHVKHNDAINNDEIEYVIELTSVVIKYLVRVLGGRI